MEKDLKEAQALFRYGLISEFLNGGLSRGQQTQRMQELSQREYHVSWQSSPLRVSIASLRRWLSKYRRSGFPGLKPKNRSDKDVTRAIDPIISDRIIAVKKSDPHISISVLISTLECMGEIPVGSIKHSTVHRLLQRHGLSGRPGRDKGMKKQRLPYRYRHPMELWVGDVMHSDYLVDGRKIYLVAWMDNATRAMMHAEYRFSESAMDILSTFKDALLVRGICQRVYVDHGSGYIDKRFARTCAHLGIHLMMAPVKDGAAKGCIERFFNTLRGQFEKHLKAGDLSSIETINSLLWRWIHSTYHQRSHKGLTGDTPWGRFMSLLPKIDHRRVKPDFDFLGLWKCRDNRVVHRDGTIRLKGHILEVPPTVTQKHIELRYLDESLPADVEVWENDQYIGPATHVNLQTNTRRRRWHPKSQKTKQSPLIDPLTKARNTWQPGDAS